MTEQPTTDIVELSPNVFKQFLNHYEFEFRAKETTGILFGSVGTAGQGQVHYAPPFQPQISLNLRLHDYAYGRYEASVEAVYHLHRWMTLGYWLAYRGNELSPEEVMIRLRSSLGGEMPLPEPMLLTLRETMAGSTEIKAYTSDAPLTGWRNLTPVESST
ncbi:hypothetical protein Q0M94_17880 (plasmid) [Deinococcus radiomollis]|uniref:hypothetical protein n=1 Tax=Deinococcus radiomollis TaxID=468916 RepID=UPI003891683F